MKPEYFLPVVIVPWIWFIVRLRIAHQHADSFLQRMYQDHRDLWKSLGCPCGSWWSAPGYITNPFTKFRFRWKWLQQDAEWLVRAPELRDLFEQMRQGFREWWFRAMPIMTASALAFFLIVKLLNR